MIFKSLIQKFEVIHKFKLTSLVAYGLIGVFTLLPPIPQFQHLIDNLKFIQRGIISPSGQVGVLAIDDKSIDKFGRWPFSRDIYQKALENLKKRGVEWLGFDVVFSEPQRTLLEEIIPWVKENEGTIKKGHLVQDLKDKVENSPGDISFSEALFNFKNIVQGYYFFEHREQAYASSRDALAIYEFLKEKKVKVLIPPSKKLTDYPLFTVYGGVTNIPLLRDSSENIGFFNNISDSDGLIRKSTLARLFGVYDDKTSQNIDAFIIPSLDLVMASRILKREIEVTMGKEGFASISLYNETDSISLPINSQGKIIMNHYGPGYTFPHISLAEAYDDKLPKDTPKYLILGGTGTGINDERPSPFSGKFDGVEHHTATLENILTQKFLRQPSKYQIIEKASIFIIGLGVLALSQILSGLMSFLAMIALIVSLYFVDFVFLFKWRSLSIDFSWAYLEIIIIFLALILIRYLGEEKEKKKVKNAFQHYLNPQVVEDLMQNPERLKLGGEKKELTVFFSDIRGFTTLSETLTPDKLSQFLNEYFTPMTQIILDSQGLLDKYIGDAIMAVWGAPLHLEDHSDRGVRASLKMFEVLKGLKEQWKAKGLPPIDIGIGLNTGPMSIGNMGSHQRFDYTVLGDAVNLGARLEGMNKYYGTKIIISEFTQKALKYDDYLIRLLDYIKVKGKTQPVGIYEVISFKPGNAWDLSIMESFHQGRQLYLEQKWSEALIHFEKCHTYIPQTEALKSPKDGPSSLYIERCLEFIESKTVFDSPWDGVWSWDSK